MPMAIAPVPHPIRGRNGRVITCTNTHASVAMSTPSGCSRGLPTCTQVAMLRAIPYVKVTPANTSGTSWPVNQLSGSTSYAESAMNRDRRPAGLTIAVSRWVDSGCGATTSQIRHGHHDRCSASRRRPDVHGTAHPFEALDDRTAHTQAIRGNGRRIEPHALVGDHDRDDVVIDEFEFGDRDARVPEDVLESRPG